MPKRKGKGRKIVLKIIAALIVIGLAYILYQRFTRASIEYPDVTLTVTSTAFENGGAIPVKYTGRGENISPDLQIGELDGKAQSIAILMDDLDHPIGAYNHWILFDIPASMTGIPEHVEKGETVVTLGNAVQGRSEYGGKHYYRGPLPPFGCHRYVFRVYALDVFLKLSSDTNKTALLKAMEGHILQYGELTGTYENK